MRLLIQRVKSAGVTVGGERMASIGKGLLIFVGVGKEDTARDARRLAGKVSTLRIFEDEKGKMNLNVAQASGQVLSVPQFTLYADLSRGNRPGFEMSAPPDVARELWGEFCGTLREAGLDVSVGRFGAHMDIDLVNDGPVTIWLE